MLIICGMQAESGEEVLSAGEETLRLGKSYSGGGSKEFYFENRVHTHGGR